MTKYWAGLFPRGIRFGAWACVTFATLGTGATEIRCASLLGDVPHRIDRLGPSHMLTSLETGAHGGFIQPEQVFRDYSSDNLFIGFTEQSMYLVFRNTRFLGGLLGRSQFNDRTHLLSPGVLVRIRRLPADVADALARILREQAGEFSASCSVSAVEILERGGLRLNVGGRKFLPHKTLEALLTMDSIYADRRRIPIQHFLINTPSLNHFRRRLRSSDRYLIGAMLIPSLIPVTLSALGIFTY